MQQLTPVRFLHLVSNKSSTLFHTRSLVNNLPLLTTTATKLMSSGSGRSEGSIRDGDTVFGKKEKVIEDQYFRVQEVEKIKHLKEELLKQKAKLAEIEDKIDELAPSKE
ncbi:474_t:CDS:2 [Ambispora gerdemannii]|uniref:ATPase inhibitor, mitochondrial n=1 Tax=Ambispora gerdemannii TaxID=144530 RepID=A0A9N9CQY7_9GLOM|nr:474_t:CDS:2 [Ambispora gerdemannii]